MEKTLKQLKTEEQKIRGEINTREEEEVEKVQIPRLKSMVGQCFAYRKNCYSSPSKPSDYWDVFRKILGWVNSKERGFHFIIEEFELDANGRVSLTIDNHFPYINSVWWDQEVPFPSYKKIEESEYNIERAKMMIEMASQEKLKKILNSKQDY